MGDYGWTTAVRKEGPWRPRFGRQSDVPGHPSVVRSRRLVRPPTRQTPHFEAPFRPSHAATPQPGHQASEVTAAHVLDVDGLVRAGRIRDAISLSHGALFLGDQSPEAIARIRLTLSSLLFMSGRVDESLAQAIAILEEPKISNSVRAGARLGELRGMVMAGDCNAARLGVESILAGAEWAGADLALSGAFETLGYLAWDEGRADRSLALDARVDSAGRPWPLGDPTEPPGTAFGVHADGVR